MNFKFLLLLALALILSSQADGFRMLRSRINQTKSGNLPRRASLAPNRRITVLKTKPSTTTTTSSTLQYANVINGQWSRIGKRSETQELLLMRTFCKEARNLLDRSNLIVLFIKCLNYFDVEDSAEWSSSSDYSIKNLLEYDQSTESNSIN
jgi:hypothetical protein